MTATTNSGKKEAVEQSAVGGQTEPTPRPWETYACHVYASGENGGNVCSMSDPHARTTVGYAPLSISSPGLKQAPVNAELICRAVNNFDALLAVAKKLANALESGYDELSRTWANFPDKPELSHLDLLRTAIKNAESSFAPSTGTDP